MPLQTIPDGSRCGQLSDWSCEFGFTPSGTLPLCTGSQFSPGSVRCVGNPCDQDPRVDAPVIVGMKQGLNRDLNQPGDFLGAFDVSRTCRGTASGKQCPFHCSDGLRPSGPLTCTAGDFDTQTCVEIDACQSWPCGVSFSCTDISATSGGLDNANGRTCAAHVCNALPNEPAVGSLRSLGYFSSNPTATTVTGIGTIACATGYMLVDKAVPASINCTANGHDFTLSGCTPSRCSGVPTFLSGFNFSADGLTLATLPSVPAVAGFQTCAANRIKSGSAAVTARCDLTGAYVQDSGDIVCAPCTVVSNAAPNANYTCTDSQDSRVDGCRLGHYHKPGNDDVALTIANEASIDACIACAPVLFAAGGTGISCTSAADSRVDGCRSGYFHTEGGAGQPDTCTPCTPVVDAAPAAQLNCTHENNTRVAACRAQYVLAPATNVDTADSCWTTPPSVKLTLARDYSAISATEAAYDAFLADFKVRLSRFLTIDITRIVVTSVSSGSVVVYFYLTAAPPSAPANEYTTQQAYAALSTGMQDGSIFLEAAFGAGASFDRNVVMPDQIPVGYTRPPPPPPPVACSSLGSEALCLGHAECAWETTTPRCTTTAEALAQKERETRLLIYLIVVAVLMFILLCVCICYATKLCCFRLKPIMVAQSDERDALRTPTPVRSMQKSQSNKNIDVVDDAAKDVLSIVP